MKRAFLPICLVLATAARPANATPPGPAFDCSKIEPGSIEAMVCENAELSALDRKLADVYAAASAKATNEHPPLLKAEQRGWVKGRNDCWKSDDKIGCIRESYILRITELQARYRLVPVAGSARYICDNNPANEVVATYFHTDPQTLIAERGDSTSLMYIQPSASGSKYMGRNESLWEHHGDAVITWGYGAPEMHCKKIP